MNKQENFDNVPLAGNQPKISLDFALKGRRPHLSYPFYLADIFATIPSLDAFDGYMRIKEEFENISGVLFLKHYLKKKITLPPASDINQALSLLTTLLAPYSYPGFDPGLNLNPLNRPAFKSLKLDTVYPFPMHLASREKFEHTLMWTDTNIKINSEKIGRSLGIPPAMIAQIVESSFRIYSYLLKMQEYRLRRFMSFNFSMFFQDRILNLIFADRYDVFTGQLVCQGKHANHIALRLLKNFEKLTFRQMCTLSVFMGTVWTCIDEIQEEFKSNPVSTLYKLQDQLESKNKCWCIDHIDEFLEDVGAVKTSSVAVILDDNGESVFDIALFQKLLFKFKNLEVIFVVNRYPVSNNISLQTFNYLLEDEYFSGLKNMMRQGRVEIVVEEQLFRSFEVSYLQPGTKSAIENADFTYIKGTNFFETLQLPGVKRYHCFTVHGLTSTLLTGCKEGNGIFAKLEPRKTGYIYNSSSEVVTLMQQALKGEIDNAQ